MYKTENSRQITVSEMAPHVHSFLPNENKVNKIAGWLTNWINLALENRKIQPYDFLPTKSDLAFHIGASLGTMQNVYRQVEDLGYIESKQRIGTYIAPFNNKKKSKKLTSKRELVKEVVKRYIVEANLNIGDKLTSLRKIAEYTGFSNTTVRMAVTMLAQEKVLKKEGAGYIIISPNLNIEKIEVKTLVEKTADEVENYIKEQLKSGDKLPTNKQLMKMFNVSVKTIHDAIKILSKKGILYTRRGKYGTIILGKETDSIKIEQYDYEKIQQKIRNYIAHNCQEGDKLPSIKELANLYNTSEKTVKKALDMLAEDGYLTFTRGRYGGTFVTDIPQDSNIAYKWLAISSKYIPDSEN